MRSNITSVTLACDDDWQLEAHKMSNITNVNLNFDSDLQRDAHKANKT